MKISEAGGGVPRRTENFPLQSPKKSGTIILYKS
jgi:hypothetical protein